MNTKWLLGKDMPLLSLLSKMSELTQKLAELELAKNSVIAVSKIKDMTQNIKDPNVKKLIQEKIDAAVGEL